MNFDNNNKPTGAKRIVLATKNSMRAFIWLCKNESAFKQELLLLILTIGFIAVNRFSVYDNLFLLLSVLFILFAEIVNTAIEAIVDRVSLELHPLSGLAKDLGSAAVLVALLIALLVWSCVLYVNFT